MALEKALATVQGSAWALGLASELALELALESALELASALELELASALALESALDKYWSWHQLHRTLSQAQRPSPSTCRH